MEIMKLNNFYKLDPKSIGVARVLLGLISIFFFISFISEIPEFYSTKSVLSLESAKTFYPNFYLYSAFPTFNSDYVYFSIGILGFILSVFLFIGLYSRLSTFLLWIIINLIYTRNPSITYAGDQMLRLSYFWFSFFPYNDSFSFFKIKNIKKNQETPQNFIFLCWALQVFILYEASVLYKLEQSYWTTNLNIIQFALNAEYMSTFIGSQLAKLDIKYLKMAPIVILMMEIILPFGIILPISKKLRNFSAFTLIIFHLIVQTALNLGIISLLSITWVLTMLSSFPTFTTIEDFFYKKYITINGFPQRLTTRISHFNIFRVAILIITFTSILVSLFNNFTSKNKNEKNFFVVLSKSLNLEQKWYMFANPKNIQYDYVYIPFVQTSSNKFIDYYSKTKKPNIDKSYFDKVYSNIHWRFFKRKVREDNKNFLSKTYLLYLCRKWNQENKNLDTALNIFLYDVNYKNINTISKLKDTISCSL